MLKLKLIHHMKIYRTLKASQDDTFSGNCGMYAVALAKKAVDNNKRPVIVVATDTTDLNELAYGEPNIYHVAVEVDGTLYDGRGITNENELSQFVYDIYGDSNPSLVFLQFNDDVIKMIRQQTDWDTSWETYYENI